MRRDERNRFGAWCSVRSLTLAALMVFAASAPAAETRMEAVKTAPEPAPQQPPPNNWFRVRTPGVSALARPQSFLQYGPAANSNCCPGRRCGHCCRQILAWATYFPKYRVCSYANCCNSCQYKGVVPLYLYFLNPKCTEGSGVQATFANECYRGTKDCAACGHP